MENRITVTGHSLGGAITQVLAANNDLSAVTFNAPGVLHLLNPLQILKALNGG
ncbi:lipase family protein [Caldibacillus thermoamylovorans]